LAAGESADLKLDPNTVLLTVFGQLDREILDFRRLSQSLETDEPGLTPKAWVRDQILDVNDVTPHFTGLWQVI
jgi:hypothetical protein